MLLYVMVTYSKSVECYFCAFMKLLHFTFLTFDSLFVYIACQHDLFLCLIYKMLWDLSFWQTDSRTCQPVSTEYQHKTTGAWDIAFNGEAWNSSCPRLLGQSVCLLSRQGRQSADPTRWLRQAPSQWEVSYDATLLVENALEILIFQCQ